MTARQLNQFLKGEIEILIFKNSIQQEVSNYEKLSYKTGSTRNIHLEENEIITISKKGLNHLLKETINHRLSNIELAYICDALTLTENIDYENENLQEIIYELADPEINGGYKTKDELIELSKKIILQTSPTNYPSKSIIEKIYPYYKKSIRRNYPKWFLAINTLSFTPIIAWPFAFFGSIFLFDNPSDFLFTFFLFILLNSYPILLCIISSFSFKLFKTAKVAAVIIPFVVFIGFIVLVISLLLNNP